MRRVLLTLLAMAAASLAGAATLLEDFSTDPAADGWRAFGNTNLFQWDTTNHNLRVAWDSSQTNSYFYHLLGTILNRDDDFHLEFDLVFQDCASGTTPGLPYTFPVAIGFLNLDNATQINFARGSGINPLYGPKNLVEFNFFPAFDTFSPTIAQVVVSTNNTWLYNHDNLLDMPPGDLFHISMDYIGATQTLATVVTRNGLPYGQTQTISVPANFDFHLAAVSVSSYSDQYADGSILAHGTVDNLGVTVPPPPIQNLTGAFSSTVWSAQFLSRRNWLYVLERSTNLQSWAAVSTPAGGNGTNLLLPDTNAPGGKSFYRVRASRP